MIKRPVNERILICELTSEDMKSVKTEMARLRQTLPDEPIGFKRSKQYVQGDIDFIINRMRGDDRNCHGVSMVCNENPLSGSNFIDIMNPATFSELAKMTLHQHSESCESLMTRAQGKFAPGVPFEHFNSLLVGLYSTTGMKQRLKKGEFSYDSYSRDTGGHFIMAELNMSTSTVVFYDSINSDIRQSSYFDFALIARVFQNIYSYYKLKRNLPLQLIIFQQQALKSQGNNDCGCHTLVNIELLLREQDPALQTFNSEIIQKIRKYHFLLRHQFVNDFRLKL